MTRHTIYQLAVWSLTASLTIGAVNSAFAQATKAKPAEKAVAAKAAPAKAPPAKTTEKPSKAVKLEAAPDYNIPQVAFINKEIRQVWADNNLTPSPPAADHEWCRRVYLDVLGRIPSVQELREFMSSKETDKKSKLVSKLLFDLRP
ncbi:MAG: DUF1549 domain-containing protein [Planctomycetales bacterium]|nr:DUF1549 domain-containing protein [Planctomycetales bacterium]